MSDSEQKKNQRKQELAEKLRRLDEYKKRKDLEEQQRQGAQEAVSWDKLSSTTDVDELVNQIGSISFPKPGTVPAKPAAPAATTTAATAPKQTTTTTTTTATTASPVISPAPAADAPKPKRQLTLTSEVTVLDITPKAVDVYTKEVQTPDSWLEQSSDLHTSQSQSHLTIQPHPPQQVPTPQPITSESSAPSTPTTPTATLGDGKEAPLPEIDPARLNRILESRDFGDFMTRTSKYVEKALSVSSKYDILKDYGDVVDITDQTATKREVTLELTLFDERWSKHRAVTDIDWSQKHPEMLISSYGANEAGSHDPDGVVLMWSLPNMLGRPEYVFHCQSPVMTAFLAKFHPTLIVGGTYSGQIVLWDTRAKATPVQKTPLSSIGHTHPVYSMSIVGTPNAHNLVTVSTDGRLCVWSLENLMQPQEVLELHNKQSKPVTATAPVAVTCLGFQDGEVNGFLVGSEESAVYMAYRHGSKAGVYERYEGHYGPVTGLSVHHGGGAVDFSDLFLTSSTDWTSKLWSTKTASRPLASFEEAGDYVYDVQWCPTHPAVFASVDGTGGLDIYNLNEDTEVPVTKTTVGTHALNRVRWAHDGKRIATGDCAGSVFIHNAGQLSVPQPNDYKLLAETIERLRTNTEREEETAQPPI